MHCCIHAHVSTFGILLQIYFVWGMYLLCALTSSVCIPCPYVSMCIWGSAHVRACVYVCVCAHVCVCAYMYVRACVCVCVCVCMHAGVRV